MVAHVISVSRFEMVTPNDLVMWMLSSDRPSDAKPAGEAAPDLGGVTGTSGLCVPSSIISAIGHFHYIIHARERDCGRIMLGDRLETGTGGSCPKSANVGGARGGMTVHHVSTLLSIRRYDVKIMTSDLGGF